jgi:hypothetical protein
LNGWFFRSPLIQKQKRRKATTTITMQVEFGC